MTSYNLTELTPRAKIHDSGEVFLISIPKSALKSQDTIIISLELLTQLSSSISAKPVSEIEWPTTAKKVIRILQENFDHDSAQLSLGKLTEMTLLGIKTADYPKVRFHPAGQSQVDFLSHVFKYREVGIGAIAGFLACLYKNNAADKTAIIETIRHSELAANYKKQVTELFLKRIQ